MAEKEYRGIVGGIRAIATDSRSSRVFEEHYLPAGILFDASLSCCLVV
jgi:hypothetical protein